MNSYTFLTSMYKNTVLEEAKLCLDSMENQTIKPQQIVIVVDGGGEVCEDLTAFIKVLEQTKPDLYTIVRLEKNVGLGNALKEGMKFCRNELIARMDTDDININDRIEKQLKCFEKDPDLSIVGSNIAEFEHDITNVVSYRNVPSEHNDICKYLKSRCPFNHMTVLFKKSEVLKSGGYLHWHYNEDSYLWVRMYLAGCKFYNIPDNLVYARVDKKTFQRRGGWQYYKSERDLFKFMYKNKVINFFEYQKAKFIRFVVQVLMTNSIRQWFFKKFARQ